MEFIENLRRNALFLVISAALACGTRQGSAWCGSGDEMCSLTAALMDMESAYQNAANNANTATDPAEIDMWISTAATLDAAVIALNNYIDAYEGPCPPSVVYEDTSYYEPIPEPEPIIEPTPEPEPLQETES